MMTPDLNLSRTVVLNVNTFDDQNDGSAANGLSLRDAIIIANTDTDNEYIINLEAGVYNVFQDGVTQIDPIDSFDGAFNINNNITIRGVDSDTEETVIDGSFLNQNEGIFFIESGQESILTLENLNLENSPNTAIALFSPIAKLNLKNSTIENSQGSAIINQGTAYIEDSNILNNSNPNDITAISAVGFGAGGIQNIGTGVMTIINSTIAGNTSANGAGGIINTFIPIDTEFFGGAGDLTIINSTISDNTSFNGSGGGIRSVFVLPEGTEDLANAVPVKTQIINSTIVNNQASNGAGIFSEELSLFNNNVIVQNSIIGDNTGSADVEGIFNLDSTYNIIGSSNLSNLLDGFNNNIIGTIDNPIDIRIGPLQDNGGETFTHGLAADSPAVNAGNNAFTEIRRISTLNSVTDQTGAPRIVDQTVDIGSYEFNQNSGAINPSSSAIVLDVDTFEDQNDGSQLNGLSLRDAILIANDNPSNEYIINLPAGTYNLTINNVLLPTTDTSADAETLFQSRLTTGDLDIIGNVTIIGEDRDSTIIDAISLTGGSGNDGDDPFPEGTPGTTTTSTGDRIFDVLSATSSSAVRNGELTVENITIQNGSINTDNIDTIANGGALNVELGTNATFFNSIIADSISTAQGGGINNDGTLILEQTIVSGNNSGDNAGGIFNNGTLTIRDSAIIDNLADAAAPDIIEGGGGGVLNEAGATLDIINTTISGNRSASGTNQDGPGDGGGGILSRGDTRIINSTIANNSAQVGSGIYSETTTANTLLINTLVAENIDSPDLDGFFDSNSRFNLIGNGNGVLLNGTNGNIVGGNGTPTLEPMITPLQDNGGNTPTHALLPNSPAMDSGDNNTINLSLFFPQSPVLDQRGSERISNGITDIGSYELFVPNANNPNPPDNNIGINSENSASENDSLLNNPIIRFQNTTVPGTYLYANQDEAQNIRDDFPIFEDEGEAFKVSLAPDDDLIAIYRFQNSDVPSTYLYVGAEERVDILQNHRNFVGEGVAFYVYGADANQGVDVFRFQSTQNPGTYLYTLEDEKNDIVANSSSEFTLEGVAFEVAV